MTLRIAVVGGGWYGCHIGGSLLALGFDITVFEQHQRLFHEASGNNQFRLHQGFHYARHHNTRIQSRDGYFRFIERYGELSRDIPQNIYAVPHEDSLVDWQTYKLIMTATGLNFREEEVGAGGLVGMDGAMCVDERGLLTTRARDYFTAVLGANLRLGCRVSQIDAEETHVEVDGERFDFLVDTTWGHMTRLPVKHIFEPTLLLYYSAAADLPAITLVDGPLCSVYPTETPRLYTLSSVPHTPLGQASSPQEACAIRAAVTADTVEQKKRLMEEQISRYMPDFKDRYRFEDVQLAIKTKPVGRVDDRSCVVYRQGRIASVMSGKIDAIFFAAERILTFLQTLPSLGRI